MNNILYLPVSIGEAIDKLTILDIKCYKITDNRKNDVKKEYELLYDKLKDFVVKYQNLYETMKKVNLLIWDMMDSLRDGDLNEHLYLQICKECIEYNDIRFRVKNKINSISESFLKEQKSYKINRLIIKIEKEITENHLYYLLLLNIVKYFSFIYDEIIIESDYHLDFLKKEFYYDQTILFVSNTDVSIDYKCKVIFEDKEYTNEEIYNLFNITENEIKKIC
jgi:hypothetical protein